MFPLHATLIAALGSTALAHGGVTSYIIDGKNYTGYDWTQPNVPQTNLIQRTWHMNPLSDLSSPNITCNNKGLPLPGAFHAALPAGSTITTTWRSVDTGFGWVHTVGPVMAYMASCGADCTTVDTAQLKWFKIAEEGLRPGFSVGEDDGWFQNDLWENRRTDRWDVVIPEGLKAGRYMVRHEIINLELDPVQLYPNCAQVEVLGSGEEVPGEEFLVQFPGGYKLTDPGIAISGKVRGSKGVKNYTVPGPKVWRGE